MKTTNRLVLFLTAASLVACNGDEPPAETTPDAGVVEDTEGQDTNDGGEEPDILLNPYGPCEIALEAPPGLRRGTVDIKAWVAHPDGLEINMDTSIAAVVWPGAELASQLEIGGECDWYDGREATELSSTQLTMAGDGGQFTLTWNSDQGSDPPALALACATVIIEMQLPEGSPAGWKAPFCEARVTIPVDNQAPKCDLDFEDLEPKDDEGDGQVGIYVAEMPFRARFKENAVLDKIELKTVVDGDTITLATVEEPEEVYEEADGEDIRKFDFGTGELFWETPDDILLDVCDFGTDLVSFTVEATDTAGNVGTCSLTPRIVRCPDMVVADEVGPPPELTVNSITPYDVNGDGFSDIVAATSGGVAVYYGSEDGVALNDPSDPLTIPVDIGTDYVVVDNLDGTGDDPDFITIRHGGEESLVQVWVSGTVCEPPTAEQRCEFLKNEVLDFDPNVEGDEISYWDIMLNLSVDGQPLFSGDCEADVDTMCDLKDAIAQITEDVGVRISLDDLVIPGTCRTDYGEAERHLIPTQITTHLYREVVKDSPDSALARDLLLGGADGNYALSVLVRAEPLSECKLGEQRATFCGVETVPGTEGVCFNFDAEDETNHVFSGPPGVNSLAADDIISKNGAKLIDVVASHDEPGTLTVFQQVNAPGVPKFGAKWISETDPSKGPITRVIAAEFGDELGGGSVNPYTDLMILMPESGEIWQLIGQGDGNFEVTPTPTGGSAPYRVASCVEGRPVDMTISLLGDPEEDFFDPLIDLVVINDDTNTLWTFTGEEVLTSAKFNSRGGILFNPPRIIDTVDRPKEIKLADINGDNRLDAITLGEEGDIAVAFAGNTELLPTDPKFSEEQTFVGAVNITTPIPEQGSNFNVCNEPGDSALNRPLPGTPLSRLTPTLMDTADMDGDDYPDLVLMTERTPINTSDPELENLNFMPFFVYQANSAPFVPELTGANSCIPVTQVCPNPATCSAPFGADKGITTAMRLGRFTFSPDYGIAWSTATEFDNTLELATIGTATWLNFPSSADCPTKPAKTPLGTSPDWLDVGVQGPSNTQLMTTIECNNDPYHDLLMAGLVTENDATFTEIWVRQNSLQSLPDFTTRLEVELLPGVGLPTAIKTTRFGGITGIENDQEDFMLIFPKGIEFFQQVGNSCNFVTSDANGPLAYSASASSPIRDAVAQDLDNDGIAELIVASANRIDVVKGQNVLPGSDFQIGWTTPTTQLPVGAAVPQAVTLSDVNGDGDLDIVTLMPSESAVWVYLNLGSPYAYWPKPIAIRIGPNATQFAPLDVNRDGCADLVALSPANKAVSLLKNRGNAQGTCFAAPEVLYPGAKSAPIE